jgi:Zn ribbon nucleic-acid-binding protein
MQCDICNKQFETEKQFIRHCTKKRDVDHSKLLYNENNIDEWVECKICGYRKKTLRDHVKIVHNLSVEEYKKLYGDVYSKQALETVKENGRKMTGDKCTGVNNPFYGKHHTQESKDQISTTLKEKNVKLSEHFNKGRVHTQETRDKMSKSRTGEKNPMYGRARL